MPRDYMVSASREMPSKELNTKVDTFVEDILKVCEKHNMTLSVDEFDLTVEECSEHTKTLINEAIIGSSLL